MLSSSLLKNKVVESARQRRDASMEHFIERHSMELLRAARSYSEHSADAEDAYQCTIEKLLSKAPEGYDDDRLLAWALTVVRNEALMERRRNKKNSQVSSN